MSAWFAFGVFGFYVGSLCGLSTSPVTLTLMPLLFTFAGGSIFAFFGRMTEVTRQAAFSALGFASFGALIGTYSAIMISSHSLLGPKNIYQDGSSGYLRSEYISNIEAKLRLLEQGALKPTDAAKEIREEISKGKSP